MAQNSLIQIRVEDSLKKQADELFNDLGLDTPTAIRIFLKQALKRQALPFEVTQSVPNPQTVAAMEAGRRLAHSKETKRYSDFSELLAEVLSEEV